MLRISFFHMAGTLFAWNRYQPIIKKIKDSPKYFQKSFLSSVSLENRPLSIFQQHKKLLSRRNFTLGIVKMETNSACAQGMSIPTIENHELMHDIKNDETTSSEKLVPAEGEETRQHWPWRKAKKVAVMISFCGKDYIGMQRNPGFKTIEEELMKAFRDTGVIAPDWFDEAQKAFFQRASRTDKGVSAAKMIISLKMLTDENSKITIDKINKVLPEDIRVQSIKRVTKNFNSKSACDARTYTYLMPTYGFAPAFPTDINSTNNSKSESSNGASNPSSKLPEDFVTSLDFRLTPELREKVNQVLKSFVGHHYFHNYTSGKLPLEPSSQRYIYFFECGEPFIKSNMEFVVIKVKGQSFMLHQIRKMIGMTIAVVKGFASLDTIEKTWGTERIDVPRAPGLGLLLDEVHYDRYNKRFGEDGVHEKLSWEEVSQEVTKFQEQFIYPEMVKGEVEDLSLFEWLKFLPLHTFSERHYESPDVEPSALRAAKRRLENEGLETDERKISKVDEDDNESGLADDE